jgi:hypothetical protein
MKTKTHIIDALDEFYGVRRRQEEEEEERGEKIGGGLIDEDEDMDEFDEDVVCLFEEEKKNGGRTTTGSNGNGPGFDDKNNNNNILQEDKTTQTTRLRPTAALFDGIHNGITSLGRGVSTGAQFLGDTVVSGVQVTTNASVYLTKTTVNIGKDAMLHSFNALSSTLISANVDEELIDDMSNILLFSAEEQRASSSSSSSTTTMTLRRGLSIETILLDTATNTKRMASSLSTTCLCGNRIEKAKMQQRMCSYLQTVVCEKCFSGDTRIIPRDVLHSWDFIEKPVCKQSLKFLEDTYATPVISLRKLGEVNRYYYTTSISSKEEFTRLRGFLDLQIKVASLFHSVGEKLRAYKKNNGENDDGEDNDADARNRKVLLHFLASIPDDKRRLVRGGDDAKVSVKELKELHEFRKQSEICEYLRAIEDEVVNVLESLAS